MSSTPVPLAAKNVCYVLALTQWYAQHDKSVSIASNGMKKVVILIMILLPYVIVGA